MFAKEVTVGIMVGTMAVVLVETLVGMMVVVLVGIMVGTMAVVILVAKVVQTMNLVKILLLNLLR